MAITIYCSWVCGQLGETEDPCRPWPASAEITRRTPSALHVCHPPADQPGYVFMVKVREPQGSRNTQGFQRPRLRTSTMSLLPHSVGEGKSQGSWEPQRRTLLSHMAKAMRGDEASTPHQGSMVCKLLESPLSPAIARCQAPAPHPSQRCSSPLLQFLSVHKNACCVHSHDVQAWVDH